MELYRQFLATLYCFALLYYNAHAVSCKGKFLTEPVCPGSYGTVLETASGSSAIACSERCIELTACRSFLFDSGSRLCQINAKEATSHSYGCATNVIYGRLEKSTCRDLWLYEPCSFNTSCTVPNSYCRDYICSCNIGYPYTHRTDSCVPGCSSTGYGTRFSSHPGSLNSQYTQTQYIVNSVSECQNHCLAESSFTCRWIDYYRQYTTSFTCYLSAETAVTQPQAYISQTPQLDYVTNLRNCA